MLSSVLLLASLSLVLLAVLSVCEASGGLQARFFVDANCSVPLDSLTPYPTYLQWPTLARSATTTITNSLPTCSSVSHPPVQAGKYSCTLQVNTTSTYVMVVAEWFNASGCQSSTFTQPDLLWSAANFQSGQCTSAGLKNSSANSQVVYAQIACPTNSAAARAADGSLTVAVGLLALVWTLWG